MKSLIIVLLLFISSRTIQARQYIQCALGMSDQRIILNLDEQKSTYYFVNGVHNPDPITRLKPLVFVGHNQKFHVYKTKIGAIREVAYIPTQFINVASNYFDVIIKHFDLKKKRSVKRRWGCFSSLH